MRGRTVDLALLGVAAVWGSSYLAAKIGTTAAPVLLVLFWRYGLAWLATLPLLRRRPTRDEWRVGALLGLSQAAVLVLETYGVAHTSAANAGVLISLTIVITPWLDSVGRGRSLPVVFGAAAATCVLGVVLLSVGPGLHAVRPGDGLVLAAAFVRAAHVVLVGRLTAHRPVRSSALTSVQLLVGTALFAGPALPLLARSTQFSAGTWVALGYLAVGCSVFAFVVQTWAVQRSSPSRASLLLGTEPVWAAGIGILFAGDRLGPVGLLGAVLVVGGVYWGQAVETRYRSRPREELTCRPTALTPS